MNLSLALALGRMQTRGPGSAPSTTITIAPTFIDGIASGTEFDWVPDGAKIHIELSGDGPRAWTEADGVVDVATLLGTDATSDALWGGPSFYDPDDAGADGLTCPDAVALTGALRTAYLAGATVVWTVDHVGNFAQLASVSQDGSHAVIFGVKPESQTAWVESWDDVYEELQGSVVVDGINRMALTFTNTRAEFSCNGSAAVTATLTTTDRPVDAFDLTLFDLSEAPLSLRTLTVYDALPDTTGLPALSAPDWLPDGALAYADFVNGHYYADGAITTLGGFLVENTDWSSWTEVVPIEGDTGAVITDPGAMLSNGATVVADFEAAAFGSVHVDWVDLPGFNREVELVLDETKAEAYDGATSPNSTINGVSTSGLHRAAATLSPTVYAVSYDGSAVQSNTGAGAFIATHIGVRVQGDFILNKLTFYAPVADAALPALSALTPDDWLPEGAVAYADFVNGHYYAGGAETTFGAMFVEDFVNWNSFDPETELTAEGLSGQPVATGAFLTSIINGATFVLTVSADEAVIGAGVSYEKFPDYTLDTHALFAGSDGHELLGATTAALPDDNTGVHKAAITFDGTHIAISLDEAAVVTVAQAATWGDRNAVAFTASSLCVITTITVYPPRPDADLPALSTV